MLWLWVHLGPAHCPGSSWLLHNTGSSRAGLRRWIRSWGHQEWSATARQHRCLPGLFRTVLREQGGSLSICLHVLNTSHPCFWSTSQEDSSDDLTASRVLSPDAPSHSCIREQLGQDCPPQRLLPFAPGPPLTLGETRGLESGPRTLLASEDYHLWARCMTPVFSMDYVIPTVMRKPARSPARTPALLVLASLPSVKWGRLCSTRASPLFPPG